ncbi:MAG: hypothetical protein F6K42_38920, partial [Leptolyngbya sp. SIO1D8]|nr:hypothetical protein [Leptolyngbya sp. SIO1D8]
MKVLLWFRNDLRLHDHEPFHEALKSSAQVIPVYCFDPRQLGKTAFGFPKTGKFRAKFLIESVADLRNTLRRLGSDLIIRQGKPEVILPTLATQTQAQAVYLHKAATTFSARKILTKRIPVPRFRASEILTNKLRRATAKL